MIRLRVTDSKLLNTNLLEAKTHSFLNLSVKLQTAHVTELGFSPQCQPCRLWATQGKSQRLWFDFCLKWSRLGHDSDTPISQCLKFYSLLFLFPCCQLAMFLPDYSHNVNSYVVTITFEGLHERLPPWLLPHLVSTALLSVLHVALLCLPLFLHARYFPE